MQADVTLQGLRHAEKRSRGCIKGSSTSGARQPSAYTPNLHAHDASARPTIADRDGDGGHRICAWSQAKAALARRLAQRVLQHWGGAVAARCAAAHLAMRDHEICALNKEARASVNTICSLQSNEFII